MTEPSSLARQRRLPRLWHLTWPAILEQLLGMTVSFADTAMVGSLGASATAGVSVVASSIWLINGNYGRGGGGYSVQVANAVGRRTTPWPGKSSARGRWRWRCWASSPWR